MAALKRELSLFQLTLYGVGIILGAGIYVLIGKAAGTAGNVFWLSFVVASLIAVFTGLSYAELAGMYPKNAAEYVYTKKGYRSTLLGFLVQWLMIWALLAAAATVARGFSSVLAQLTGWSVSLIAVGLIILLSAVSYRGIKGSAQFNVVSTVIEMSGLLLVVLVGFFLFFGRRTVDYTASVSGIEGLLSASALIYFAYIGFEEIVNLAEESKNAKKMVPKALVLSIGIASLLYILVAVASLQVLGAQELSEAPNALVAVIVQGFPEAGMLMMIITLFATSNTVLAMMIVASRMVYGLAHNRLLPKALSRVGKKGTPGLSILLVLLLIAPFVFFGSLTEVASLANAGIFVVYIFINGALILLRLRAPNVKRSFRSPFSIRKVPVLAVLGLTTSGLMLLFLDLSAILFTVGVFLAGIPVYLFLAKGKGPERLKGRRHFRKSRKRLM